MSRYKTYSEYKDSGVEWIGKIPNHWRMLYSKWIFKERNIKATLDDEQLTASQKYGVISQKEFMRLENQKVTQVILNPEILKYVKEGDFVISMRSFQGGIEYSLYSGSISSAYVPIYSIQNISSSFFKYLFKSQPYIQALQSTSNLIRDGQALRYNNFIQINLPIFPIEEQQKIADFLDYETSKIDQLINKQKALIELLKEKRQALISQAVTKGLNPKAKMKDSGIQWLGEIPEHWEIKRLKFLAQIKNGQDYKKFESYNGKYPVIGSGGEFARSEKYLYKEESVLLGRKGTIDKPLYINTPFWTVDTMFYTKVSKQVIIKYLYYCCLTINFKYYSTNTAVPSMTQEDLGNNYFAVPVKDEQQKIADFLDDATSKIDKLLEKSTKAVNLLQERRTALISAAVKGKIDVRDWQSPNAIDTMTNITPN